MEDQVLLYDSILCRLCGEENENGTLLYIPDEIEQNLRDTINKYLPLKVFDDGKFPRTICPGCNIQLDAMVQFLELIVIGQEKLRELWKLQQEEIKRREKHKQMFLETPNLNSIAIIPVDDENGKEILVQILPDGTLYAPEHEMTLKVEGLEKPRRKRGRPPKPPPQIIELKRKHEEISQEPEEDDSDGRKRRRRKVPTRFLEAVQGKELERMFREEGVIEDGEEIEDSDVQTTVKLNETETGEEIIGHIENKDGQDLGELITINKTKYVKSRNNNKSKRKKNYTCEQCGRGFVRYNRFVVHKSFHKEQQENVVKIVDKLEEIEGTEIELQNLEVETHNENHINDEDNLQNLLTTSPTPPKQTHTCEICLKTFNHPSSVTYHRESVHNDGHLFVCNKCNKTFKHKQLLQRHQLVHSDERPFTCKSCGATFKTRSNLANHQPTHTGVKKYYCEQCGQLFAHKTSLTLHYRWHQGYKPYKCAVCGKTFSQKGNLQEHKRIHTGEKPFCCDFCGRSFTTSSQFKLHVKRHTGERPWRCEHCGKTFLHKDTWKCHVRRHLNDRPFKCTHCTRSFTEQWALKKHTRLHTGEKPYSCDVCQKTFADCSNLTKHRKVHRNGNNNANENNENENDVGSSVLYVTYDDENESGLVHILQSDMGDVGDVETDMSSQDLHVQLDDGTVVPVRLGATDMMTDDSQLKLVAPDGQSMCVVTSLNVGSDFLELG